MSKVYKIVSKVEWEGALASGFFDGSPDDHRDGYIHLSAADQVLETARRHFAGRSDLLLAVFEAETLGSALRWEPSRDGALFPHLYAPLPTQAAIEVRPMPLRPDGAPDPGQLIP